MARPKKSIPEDVADVTVAETAEFPSEFVNAGVEDGHEEGHVLPDGPMDGETESNATETPPENALAAVNRRLKELEAEKARLEKVRRELMEKAYMEARSKPGETPAAALKRTSAILAADREAMRGAQENGIRRMQAQIAALNAAKK